MATAEELGVRSVKDCIEQRFEQEVRELGDELYLLCPNPRHDDRSVGSCSVNSTTGLWSCFSCGVGGDLVRLGMYYWGGRYEECKERLAPNTPESLLHTLSYRIDQASKRTFRSREKEPRSPDWYADGPLDELLARGFFAETLEKFSVRYVASEELKNSKGEPFNIYSSIGIPVRDSAGVVRAWCYRKTEASGAWQPRYLYDRPVKEFWFGAAQAADATDVVIVEGALDAMWVDQCGFAALGLLGSSMTGSKLNWLKRYRSITLLGDRDGAGLWAVKKIGEALGHNMPVKVCRYPVFSVAKDPAETHPVDLEIMLAKALTWTEWVLAKNLAQTGQPA